jgi:hypothetical protein
MEINLVPDSSVSSAPTGFTAEVQAAANILDQDFPGNYTVNITYGWGTYDNQSNPQLTSSTNNVFSLGGVDNDTTVSYATVKGWLTDDATLTDQMTAVASLPASNSSLPGSANDFFVSSAEEKSLGVYTGSSSTIDGSIGFNINYASSDPSYVETAAFCELIHALGWMTDYYTNEPTVLDLFRYSSAGTRDWTGGDDSYFSLNGGTTDVANFSNSFDYTLFTNQRGGPTIANNDPMNVSGDTVEATGLTSLDTEVMDVIGFGPRAVPDDFNANGTSEILFRNDATGDTGFYSISNGANTGWKDIGGSSTAYTLVGTSDFSGNGADDMLFRDNTTGDTGFDEIVNGASTGWHDIGASSTAYTIVGTGDFTGNGSNDILYRDNSTGDTGFYAMVEGVKQGWVDVGASSTAYSVVGVGDFTGSGTDDIVYRDYATGDTGFYELVNGVNTGWHDIGSSSTAYSVVGVGDFFGNGTDDILFRDNSTGDTGFYAISNGVNTGWHDIGASSTAYSVVATGDYLGTGTDDILFHDNATGDTGFYAISNGVNTGWHDVGASSTAYSVVT